MSGGIRPSIIRASGVSEGGKTSCALSFAKNFQDSVENSMVVYIKSEGRLSPEMLGRSGLDVSPEKLFIYKSNIFIFNALRSTSSRNDSQDFVAVNQDAKP